MKNDISRRIHTAAAEYDRAYQRLQQERAGDRGRSAQDRFKATMAVPGLSVAERLRLRAAPPEEFARRLGQPSPLDAAWDAEREARSALYSAEFLQQIERLRKGDAAAAEYAIAYIEADPRHFHSGYLKQKLARYLRHVPLTEPQSERLDSPSLRRALKSLATSKDEKTSWRAARTLAACELNDRPERKGGA